MTTASSEEEEESVQGVVIAKGLNVWILDMGAELVMGNMRKKTNSSKDDSSVSEDMDMDIIPDTKQGLPAALRQAGHEFFLEMPSVCGPRSI